MGIPERWARHRPLPQDIELRLEAIIPIFEKQGVLLAYLFGSLSGKGENPPRPPGDVDLAVLTRDGPAYILQDALIDALGTDRLDLVDLRKASPVLRFEILRTGLPIYVLDEKIQERYEVDTIHVYRDTAPMRRRHMEYMERRMAERCLE